jgi:hypothetical protein
LLKKKKAKLNNGMSEGNAVLKPKQSVAATTPAIQNVEAIGA